MMKRARTGADDDFHTSQKRRKQKGSSAGCSFHRLSDEVILQCFAYLSANDLLAAQASRRLYALTKDGQLWRRLFLQRFSSKPLRHRAEQWCSLRESLCADGQRTWKDLYRISHNWATGHAASTQFSLRSALLPAVPRDLADDVAVCNASSGEALPDALSVAMSARKREPRKSVAWLGRYYFIAQRSEEAQAGPSIAVFCKSSSAAQSQTPVMTFCSNHFVEDGTNKGACPTICSMQIDSATYDNAAGIRLAVFYNSGQYSIFRIRNIHATATESILVQEEYFSAHGTGKAVVASQLHSPLLVTSTIDGAVKFRILQESTGSSRRVTMIRPTVQTHLAFAPMSLRLQKIGSENVGGKVAGASRFRATLCYATPFYPGSCTVGVQTFDINLAAIAVPVEDSPKKQIHVVSRHAIAVPPESLHAHTSLGASNLPPDLALVTSIEQDGRYIVAAKTDNTVSVYELSEVANPTEGIYSSLPRLGLMHVRSLFGHTAAVDTVSVSDGRCVSTGIDGIKLWSLTSQHPQQPLRLSIPDTVDVVERSLTPHGVATPSRPGKCDWVGLDSTRVIAVCSSPDASLNRIKVYDFE